jgi:thioredoxin-like negative regulator of GroEL
MQKQFEEDWARNVLSTHMATLQNEAFERTKTQPSTADEEMLEQFLQEGEKASYAHREFAFDLAVAFWFLDDYSRALQILVYAPPSQSAEWMRAELLFASRRYLEALEQLNTLEIKYIDDPENTFAVSYLRAQCLHGLGQNSTALEILQSIVRVRANYRSAHALMLEWTAGVTWE